MMTLQSVIKTSFGFGDNQHRFGRDQYAQTVGAGILKKNSAKEV